MAGHSKWSQIKRKKGANDVRRSGIISKHIRAITTAVRSGGSGDPAGNLSLKNAIAAAKTDTVPVDNIENAIKRAVGEGSSATVFDEVVYEGYGPGGTALLIETLTDNRNRTVGEIRSVMNKRGGNLGNAGSVAWQFDQKGIVVVSSAEETVQDAAIELGAEDIQETEDGLEIYTAPTELFLVSEGLSGQKFPVVSASLTMIASSTVDLNDEDARKLLVLLEYLEDLDDVQRVTSNANLSEVMEEV
ncbi:MAG: YebC/PmpR family DNA-binding transcriptional regulator [Pseudopedobacter sp.]|nr:YebC/PmpR family DNA-binding transcriptional regulator [Deinococcales bacterium]